MLKNYFKTAWRNIRRNKAFSILNIVGLALGLTCSLFIFLWVRDERSMDQFNTSHKQLYVVYERQFTAGNIIGQYATPGIMADEMKRVLPQVAYACGFLGGKGNPAATFEAAGKIMKEEGAYAGADYFKMFNYKLLEGDPRSALNSPADIAISRSMAENFFGSAEKAFGKTIRFNNEKDFRVSAVFEIPENASSKFEYLINWYSFLDDNQSKKSWNNTGVYTYILLKPHTSLDPFERQITHFLNKYATFEGDYHVELGLQRFDEMYLHASFNDEGFPVNGRIAYVRLFSIVSIFILLIACINFMNLTTAASIKRSKEIGVRKVMGAKRISLIWQFIGEAVMFAFISMLIASILVTWLLPAFNTLTEKNITWPFARAGFWMNLVLIALATGILSGSYPALFLSSFNPVRVLKGVLSIGKGNLTLRKGLVVSQFVLSIVLIIGTLVVTRQVHFIESKNLGYSRENLIYVSQEGAMGPQYELFKEEALKMPGIRSVSRISYQEPSNMTNATWGIDWEGKDPNLRPTFADAGVGYDFAKTMNIKVLAGRDFDKGFSTDSIGYILNEAAIREIGYKDPIGKPFTLWGRKATIIGVIQDFNFNSLHSAVKPLVMYMENNGYSGTMLIKTQPGQTKEAIASLGALWKQLNPAFPFTYEFADEAYSQLYTSELMAGTLSNYFAWLAIFISCLGLLGLVMFTTEQRTKEIGIRKILGASAVSLFGLLSKEFMVLVMIALAIAIPIAWWGMNRWLQGYAYHIGMDWWMFILAGGMALLIALATVSFHAVRSALASPITSLRIE